MFSLVSRIIYAPNAYTGNRKNLGGTTMLFMSYKGLSRSASRTVRRALRLAGQQGCATADTGHLLLAMLQTAQGPAAEFSAPQTRYGSHADRGCPQAQRHRPAPPPAQKRPFVRQS